MQGRHMPYMPWYVVDMPGDLYNDGGDGQTAKELGIITSLTENTVDGNACRIRDVSLMSSRILTISVSLALDLEQPPA